MISKCIVVEDEPLAMERARGMINKLPYLELVAEFDNALEAIGYLKSNQVDILFLDINMDELSGIQLLETVNVEAQVIITTAYDQYALKGFELSVTDYLLKPYTLERFIQAVEKARANVPEQKNYLFVKTENRLEKVNLEDILFIEGMRDYRRIHTTSGKIMTLQSFTEFEKLLPPKVVCRVHKSYMVAIQKIDSIERSRIRIGKEYIPVSDTYKDSFFSLIK